MEEKHREVIEGEKRYTGAKRTAFLNQLADDANGNHKEATRAWQGSLEHAKKAGDALRVAKKINGGRGRWGRWADRRFEGSKRTRQIYMRLSRRWNDPRLVQARIEGLVLTSIKAVEDILSGRPPKKTDADRIPLTPAQQKEQVQSMKRDWLRKEFAAWLRKLDETELDVFEETQSHQMDKMYADLRNNVCIFLERDYYYEDLGEMTEEQSIKREVNRRVRHAMQKGNRRPGM